MSNWLPRLWCLRHPSAFGLVLMPHGAHCWLVQEQKSLELATTEPKKVPHWPWKYPEGSVGWFPGVLGVLGVRPWWPVDNPPDWEYLWKKPFGKHTKSYWKWPLNSWFTHQKMMIFRSYASLPEGMDMTWHPQPLGNRTNFLAATRCRNHSGHITDKCIRSLGCLTVRTVHLSNDESAERRAVVFFWVWLCGLCIWATMNPQNDVPSSFLVRSESTFPSSGWFGDGHMPVSPRMYRFLYNLIQTSDISGCGLIFSPEDLTQLRICKAINLFKRCLWVFLTGNAQKMKGHPLSKVVNFTYSWLLDFASWNPASTVNILKFGSYADDTFF